jgi:hypothetical protein
MSLSRCPKCGGEVSGLSGVCPTCGTVVPHASQGADANQKSPGSLSWARIIGVLALCVVAALAIVFVANRRTPVERPAVVEVINLEELRAKADSGNAEAQRKLGALYASGESVKRDYKTAAGYYRLAADQGVAGAQIALGELYEAGQGVPRDEKEAAQWYRKAADQGNAAGQYALAVMYLMGSGVTKDDSEALKWYRASAAQGYTLALFHLGMRYKKGQGVTADPVEAYKWLTLAADRGVAEATEIRDDVKSGMTREQIAEGKRRAEEFAAKLPANSPR